MINITHVGKLCINLDSNNERVVCRKSPPFHILLRNKAPGTFENATISHFKKITAGKKICSPKYLKGTMA